MTCIDTHACETAAARRPRTPFAALWALLVTWQRRADQRQQLARLDARLLRDMGISEADADLEARKPFWRA